MIYYLLILLYFIEILSFFTISYIVNTKKHNRASKEFAIFALMVGIWQLFQFFAIIFQSQDTLSSIFIRTSVFVSPFVALSFLLFSAVYTEIVIKHKRFLIFSTLVFSFISIFSENIKNLEVNEYGLGVPKLDLAYILVLIYISACIITGVYLIYRHYVITKEEKNKAQDKIMLFSLGFASLIILFSSFQIDITSNNIFSQQLIPFTILSTALIFMYAIAYRNLFDIRPYIARIFGYFLSVIFIVLIYLFSSLLFAKVLFNLELNLNQLAFFAIWCTFSILLYVPIKSFFDKITKKIFYRNAYDTQNILNDINSHLVSIRDIDSTIVSINELIKSNFNVNYSSMLFSNVYSEDIKIYGDNLTAVQISDLGKVMKLNNGVEEILLVQDNESTSREVRTAMKMIDVEVICRLKSDFKTIGYWALGAKKNGTAFTSQDLQLVRIVSGSIAVAVQSHLRFKEIERFNETLQQNVKKATADLQKSNEKLKSLDEAKDEFISMASHQLRTPLTSVKGYISMLLEGDAGPITEQQKTFLSQAFTSSQRMVYLIADLLNVSRLKTGKFVIEPAEVDLPQVVRTEVEQLQTTADSRGLTLKIDCPKDFPTLMLDETKIHQVIMNFIDNAIYYTPSGGSITVALGVTKKTAELKVVDTGIGVPKKAQHELFTKFFRADNAQKARPDGTGLGLFMAKKVIIAQGGSIIFSSTENKGSTFGFSFALDKVLPNKTDQLK